MKRDKTFSLDWEEIRFSAVLIGYMRTIRDREDVRLQIDPENYLYNKDILDGKADPLKAPRIDIRILGGWVREDVYYSIEAKILVEEHYGKRSSSVLRARYVDTGIDSFVKGKYSQRTRRGCLAGYVIQGNPVIIVDNINKLLLNRSRNSETLQRAQEISNYSYCYRSEHTRATDSKRIYLCHILLRFC